MFEEDFFQKPYNFIYANLTMTQIIKLTFALSFLSFLFGLFAGIMEAEIGVGLYYGLLISGSMFFPIMIFVALYHLLLSRRLNLSNLWLRFTVKSLSLILFSFIGLFVWAILEYLVLNGSKFDLSWVLNDYQHEYLGYMPIAIILALLIPVGHYLFRPKIKEPD
ncbi:MAG TPA: hypothetical protein VHK91_02905 [Flavisolibacter sp.]|nr:hypothetical protein [Flavisolibacter sp.]